MKQLDFRQDRKIKRKLRALYRSAFPRAERLPWWVLAMLARRRGICLSAYLDGDRFCGFTFDVHTENAVMIWYFAVDPELRAQGYGSAILSFCKRAYAEKTILLHVEPTDDTAAPNLSDRLRRVKFYEKNGFAHTGYEVTEVGGRFQILGTCGETDIVREYKQAFRRLSFGVWNVKVEPSQASKGAGK